MSTQFILISDRVLDEKLQLLHALCLDGDELPPTPAAGMGPLLVGVLCWRLSVPTAVPEPLP